MRTSESLVDSLIAAFWDDPFYDWLYDGADRAGALRDNFTVIVGFARERAQVDVSHDGFAVAVWTDPNVPLMDDPTPFFGVLDRWAPSRIDEAIAGIDACHVHQPAGAHVLHLVGVHPRLAGRGVGTRLLEPRLSVIDAVDGIAYLESSTPRNHPFYRRLGFERLAQVPIGDGPSMWPMVRRDAATMC